MSIHLPVYGLFVFVLLMHVGKYNASNKDNLVIRLVFNISITSLGNTTVNQSCGKLYGRHLLEKIYNKVGDLRNECQTDNLLKKPFNVALVPTSSFISGVKQVNYTIWLNISAEIGKQSATVSNLQHCENTLKAVLSNASVIGTWGLNIAAGSDCPGANVDPLRFVYRTSDLLCADGYQLQNENKCVLKTTTPTATESTTEGVTPSTTTAAVTTLAASTTASSDCSDKVQACFDRFMNMTLEEFCRIKLVFNNCVTANCPTGEREQYRNESIRIRSLFRCRLLSTTEPSTVTTTSSSVATTTETLATTSETKPTPIEVLNKTEGLALVEGEGVSYIYYQINSSPQEICDGLQNCSVKVLFDISQPSTATWPRCRSTKSLMQQVVFGEDSPCAHLLDTNSTWQTPRRIGLKATVDGKYDDTQTAILNIHLTKITDTEESALSSIALKINIKDMDVQKMMCASINDPHITPFDALPFNTFIQGEFVLYKHATLPFEVHTIYQSCSATVKASCNCAVMVRSGDDTIVLDRCARAPVAVNPLFAGDQSFSPLSLRLYLNNQLTPGTKIFEKDQGKKYYIYLPHGGYVKMMVNDDLINVWVVASAADFKQTQGLCGNFDGNKFNDFPESALSGGENVRPQLDEYSKKWRVPLGGAGSILLGVEADKIPYVPHKYCECKKDREEAPLYSYAGEVQTCDIYQGEDITEDLVKEAFLPILPSTRQKRALNQQDKTSTSDNPAKTITVDTAFKPPKYTWNKKSWNEVTATGFCDNYLKKKFSLSKICETIPGVNIEQEVKTCIEDIQITDNTTWASSALDGLKEQCLEQLKKNGSIPDSVFNKIEGSICINQCSGHGQCNNGTCDCDEGFSGTDCTVLVYSPPKLAKLPNYGLCDSRQRNCTIVTVYGQNYINASDLTCHIREYQPSKGNAPLVLGKELTFRGIYVNFNQVDCVLPRLPLNTSYTVSVSNDGVKKSGRLLYMPYDSLCQRCDIQTTVCIALPNSCIENGFCYEVNQTNPDGCSVCSVLDGIKQWTTIPGIRCRAYPPGVPNDNLSDLLVAIIAAVVGSLVGVLVGVFLYVCLCKRRKNKPSESLSIEERSDPQNTNYEVMAIHRDRGLTNVTLNFPHDPEPQLPQVDPIPPEYYNHTGPGVENGVNYDTYF